MELILDAVKYTAEQIRRFEQKKKKTVNQNFKFKVAWCSWIQNSVYIHEDSLQSRKIYDLQGAQPVKRFLSSSQVKGWYTLVEQVPNSTYLISSNSYCDKSNFDVIDTSSRRMRKVFTLGDREGIIYDIACNAKTKKTALLSVTDTTAYHLFDSTNWQIMKKAKWHGQHKDDICSLDFDKEGKKIVTMDIDGVCLVSDVSDDNYLFHFEFGGAQSVRNKCRWNAVNGLIAVSFNAVNLNFIDPVEQTLLFKDHLEPHNGCIIGIDWQKNGNLLATCSDDRSVKLYDSRRGKFVKTFKDIDTSYVNSVRWNSTGTLLVVASDDSSIKTVDVTTGRILSTSTIPEDGKL